MQSLVCPANLEPRKIKLLLGWLPFILLLSETFLWLSRFPSNCSLLSLQITMSSANTVARGESCLNPLSHLTTVSQLLPMSCPILTYCHSRLTHAILQILIFSFVWLCILNHPNLLHIHLCLETLGPTQCPTCHTRHCPPLPMIPLPDGKDGKCQRLTC